MPFAAALAPAIAAGAEAAGISAATAGTIGALASPVIVGAGEGALVGGLTGGSPGLGALFGAGGGLLGDITGGLGGLVPGFPGGGLGGAATPGAAPLTGGGAGVGTPVPAEAAAGAVQPTAAPGPVSLGAGPLGGGGTQLAEAGTSDVGFGGGPTSGNIAPGSLATSDLRGPSAGSEVFMGTQSLSPPSAATYTSPLSGAATPTTTLPDVNVTATPGGGGIASYALDPGFTTLPSGGVPEFAPGTGYAPTTDPAVIAGLSPNPNEAAGAYQAAGGSGGIGGILGNLGSSLLKNPGSLLSAGLFGHQLMTAPKQQAQELLPIQQAQTGAQGMATALTSPTFTGILPAGQEQALETSRRHQKAAVTSRYANAGMPGSTGEADALADVDARIDATRANIAGGLLHEAGGYAGLAATEANKLVEDKMLQDKAYADALARFVGGLGGALGGGTRTA